MRMCTQFKQIFDKTLGAFQLAKGYASRLGWIYRKWLKATKFRYFFFSRGSDLLCNMNTQIQILLDETQVSFICGNKWEMDQMSAVVSVELTDLPSLSVVLNSQTLAQDWCSVTEQQRGIATPLHNTLINLRRPHQQLPRDLPFIPVLHQCLKTPADSGKHCQPSF